jgi:GNAT superfamily N-acetyltransferase
MDERKTKPAEQDSGRRGRDAAGARLAPLVRPAVAADLALLVAFNAAMARETEGRALDEARLRRGVEHALSDPARGRYLVAESGGAVVGALLLTREWSDWRDGWFWWIQSVYVAPHARGQGVYAALHRHVESEARGTAGVCGLRLYVDRDNEGAQCVYEALGMSRSDYLFYEVDFTAVR